MIIALFHVFYLFGQYIYKNYCVKRLKALCDAAKDTESSSGLQIYEMLSDNTRDDSNDEKPTSKYREKEGLKFDPPAYIQRYSAVQDILDDPMYKGEIRKVVDFGCSELGFVRYLKNTPGVEEILCVDIDRQVLEYNKVKAEPYLMEYVCCRKTPLVIELCEGSVTHNDRKLEQTDAVICIELIEHLYPDTLMDLPFNIFEYIMPKVVIVTTPNADFNVLFPNFSGYRHPDHKFEWTREQFQDWARNIVVRYPSYSVTFHGICKGPAGTEELGTCTQMAVFHRHSLIEECNKIIGVDGLFKTVAKYDYPIYVDNRSDKEKLLHEATYHIINLAYTEESRDEVILSDILPYLEEKNFNVTIETLRKVLTDANWIIKDGEDGPIVKIDVSSSECEDEDEKFHRDNADLINEGNINDLKFEDESLGSEISSGRSSYIENWDEQPSIIIPENRSIVRENTYLFDGEHSLSEYHNASYQNGSCNKFYQFSLNSTFQQFEMANKPAMNIEKFTEKKCRNLISVPFKKSFSEKDNSCNFEQMISVKNQVHEKNDMADMVPLNICSSSSGVNNQPRFTSSPKASTKPFTNIIKQNCPELKELHAVNRNILSCTEETINETVLETNSSSLKDISQKSSNSTITETVTLCASSLSDDITNISKNNVDLCLDSNNAQQHLCLENKEFTEVVESTQGTDEKFVERNVVINRESDFADNVQNVDVHHSLSSNNKNIDNKEENVCCTLTKTNDNGTNEHQENMIDFTQPNVRKKSLNPPKELSNFKSQNNSECSSTECAKKTSVLENDRLVSSSSNKDTNNVQFASVSKKSEEIVGTSKDVNTSNIVGLINNIEAKSVSPFETPPNSWSPEIMDSGYPNSASVQDITPEYDLSSIAQDHIPDSESPSIAEAPRLGVLEPIEVENGDLANNNRDDEGNNMMAVDANDIENLQPFIDVLENDLENENDIYVMQNGFPIWLLRLLDMANPLDFDIQDRQNLRDPEDEIADDANYVGHDEGFDSSSSENESDI